MPGGTGTGNIGTEWEKWKAGAVGCDTRERLPAGPLRECGLPPRDLASSIRATSSCTTARSSSPINRATAGSLNRQLAGALFGRYHGFCHQRLQPARIGHQHV